MCVYTPFARYARSLRMRVVYTNLCHTFLVSFATLGQSARVLFTLLRSRTRRDSSGRAPISNGEHRALQQQQRTATPPLEFIGRSAIHSFHTSVQQRPGKSLTRRPSGFLNAADQLLLPGVDVVKEGQCNMWTASENV